MGRQADGEVGWCAFFYSLNIHRIKGIRRHDRTCSLLACSTLQPIFSYFWFVVIASNFGRSCPSGASDKSGAGKTAASRPTPLRSALPCPLLNSHTRAAKTHQRRRDKERDACAGGFPLAPWTERAWSASRRVSEKNRGRVRFGVRRPAILLVDRMKVLPQNYRRGLRR